MPLSPTSRFLLILIIALAGGALVVTDLWDLISLTAAAGAFAMVLAAFSSRVVNDAPPIDDQAFHLTLPPGHAGGFRRILFHHALLLGGIGAAITARCVYLGGNWLGGVMAALLLCSPVLAFCAAMATLAGLSVKPGKWRLFALAALVLPPFVSLYVMDRAQMLSPARVDCLAPTVILTAAILYPLAWLFTGLGRMRVAGVAMLAAAGALLPWLAVRGDSRPRPAEWPLVSQARPIPEPGPRPASEAVASKLPPLPDPAALSWASLPDLLEPRGLEEGEFLLINGLKVQQENSPETPRIEFNPFRDSMPRGEGMWAGKIGGGTLWDEDGVWRYLLTRLPVHEQLHFDASPQRAHPTWQFGWPGSSSNPLWPEKPSLIFDRWEVQLTGPFRWELAGPFDVERGGSARLPCGVFLKLLRSRKERRSLTLRVFGKRPALLDPRYFGPLFGQPVHTGAPHVFLVGRSGKIAIAAETFNASPSPSDPHFMEFADWGINYGAEGGSGHKVLTDREGPSPSPEKNQVSSSLPTPREIFEGGRLYVFVPVLQPGGFRSGEIPPP